MCINYAQLRLQTAAAAFMFVVAGYFVLIVPGLVLHLFCIIGAASGDPTK
jgi:hypothetical protein